MHVGCINENTGQNWIVGYLNYMIMFVNMYDFGYLTRTFRQIAASVCCDTLINKMSVSDENSLVSSECMGLVPSGTLCYNSCVTHQVIET